MPPQDAAVALRRLGLGARPGDIARLKDDPRGFVLAQLADPKAARLDAEGLTPSHSVLAAIQVAAEEQRRARAASAQGATPTGAAVQEPPKSVATPPNAAKGTEPGMPDAIAKPQAVRRDAFVEEATARFARARTTDTPLLERLVYFWSGHFAVSGLAKPNVRALAGSYEREAIRPHVLGRFADMLRAATQHPAMLIYLDNAVSAGPSSPAGIARRRGLNENLARELLELHTLGVDGGYTQADVTNLARILTGWTVGGPGRPRSEPGRFFYLANWHEPGAWPLLGRTLPGDGLTAGEAALAMLARHPSTARHIATRLARHFVSDPPPPALVARLATVFRDSDGDLAAVTSALVAAPEVWSTPPAKVVPPFDFAVSLARGFAFEPPIGQVNRVISALGQPLWGPPSPKGWPEENDAWMGPAAVRERLRVAGIVARRAPGLADPRQLAPELVGPGLSEATRRTIAGAETREQALALLIMSPEFLRR